jgi:hypothetical protein
MGVPQLSLVQHSLCVHDTVRGYMMMVTNQIALCEQREDTGP